MPIYDMACATCEQIVEDVASTIAGRNDVPCPDCGKTMEVLVMPVQTIGANWSKPIKVGHTTYETNAQLRAAEKEMGEKGFALCPKTDSHFVGMMDRLSTRREKTAQAQGFRNESHRQAVWKRRRMEGN